MTTYNVSNMFDGYLSELKTTYKFDQVVFERNNKYYVFFKGLKNGLIIDLRFNIDNKNFEAYDYSKWSPL
ncbi:hypothetical protein SAMN04487897_10157 [Paenibacillus sp. yr247]|nr:hypothetical protein SAMN04487897_10157 [Paenibacillus sp. yr247]